MKTAVINIRLDKKEKAEFAKIAKKLDLNLSQIAREGLRQRIADLKQNDKRLAAVQTV